jgi:hypothetical protein
MVTVTPRCCGASPLISNVTDVVPPQFVCFSLVLSLPLAAAGHEIRRNRTDALRGKHLPDGVHVSRRRQCNGAFFNASEIAGQLRFSKFGPAPE